MDQFLLLVYAGLTGSVTMITCTVLALTRLVFQYKGELLLLPPRSSALFCVFWIKVFD